MPRKYTKRNTVETPSGKHVMAVVDNSPKEPSDPIQAKNAEIAKEKRETKFKAPAGPKVFQTFIVDESDDLPYISQAFNFFFGLSNCGYSQNVKDWNFPKPLASEKSRVHVVWRKYFHNGIMVDLFDKKTPKEEIERIKAHIEALGNPYTYVCGGDNLEDPKWADMIFIERLKPIKGVKVTIPETMGQAGFEPVYV